MGKKQGWTPLIPGTLANDFNFGSVFDQLEQTYNVLVAHTDTAVAGGLTDEMLLVGTMDIDIAFPSILIMRLEPIEPDNTGGNEIAFFFPVRGRRRRNSPAKNRVQWLVAPDFLINSEPAKRRLKATRGLA